ncbi:DUF421 domain-containing protein [Nitrosococcus wardiae]|uniref:DUF421 domain-containing protein n=2 Tax=Nitrosococcus wardiae TaxID=1814290 RepID=A0A4P7C437_9GAMM|nr:DUF421 domain-containing protein [Nitrosococcus wardiae]
MDHLIGEGGELGWVVLKALLLYLTAIIGFRFGERRTLMEMSPFDFVAAVAVGAIVGRVPNASTTSYLAGAVTLLTLLVAHRLITQLRYFPSMADLIDPPPRLLMAHGGVLEGELRRCGLTRNDLYGLLRQQGIEDLSEVQFVICEQRGQISIVRQTDRGGADPCLVRDIRARTSS